MARLGRRQPFKPIIGRLIQYSPPVAPVGKQVVVSAISIAQASARYHRSFPPIIKGPIQYQPPAGAPIGKQSITLSLQRSNSRYHSPVETIFGRLIRQLPFIPPRPLVVSQESIAESNQRFHRPGHTLYGRLIQYAAPVVSTPVAAKPLIISPVEDIRRRHQRVFGPIFNRTIQYSSPVAPAAAKPFVVSVALRTDRQKAQRVFGPIIKGLIRYAAPVSAPPVADPPKIISFVAIETANVRYHRLYHPLIGVPITMVSSLTSAFLPLIRRDPKAPPVLRGFTERVTTILNSLMRAGELVQTSVTDWELRVPGSGSGTQGPPGPTGATGATGPTGPTGPSGGPALTVPPLSSSFTWDNQSVSTVADNADTIYLSNSGNAANSVSGMWVATPSAPWTLTVLIAEDVAPQNYYGYGLFFRESSSGKIAAFQLGVADLQEKFYSRKYTNSTSFSADYSLLPQAWQPWLRIADDNTNRIMSISADGINWKVLHTVGRTDFLTANQIGFWICPEKQAGPVATLNAITIRSWLVN